MTSRRGTKNMAMVAIGHELLKIAFVLLSRKVPYKAPVVDYGALLVKRNALRQIRQLKKFGYLPQAA